MLLFSNGAPRQSPINPPNRQPRKRPIIPEFIIYKGRLHDYLDSCCYYIVVVVVVIVFIIVVVVFIFIIIIVVV